MKTVTFLLSAALVLALCHQITAAETMRRFLLSAGANDGGQGRLALRYAVSDAEQFADVMLQMGGVHKADQLFLSDPRLVDFEEALALLRSKVRAAKAQAERTEVWVYYSGHADEEGLLLGDERLGYRSLRAMMDSVEADVRIAVLDACASGAITRIKGGQRRKGFLVDTSSDTRGYAFLTSSSAEETAQESDRIQASFFTHFLVSGMRGAADVSGDGKVTLREAYDFAFNETLAHTVETQGGAQHAAYHINLSGIGDVVMTDVRETSAGLVLAAELKGRLFVRNDDRRLVAELLKPADKVLELGLEPGRYDIYLALNGDLFVSEQELGANDRLVLSLAQFEPAPLERTAIRGLAPLRVGARAESPRWQLSRRYRIELHLGKVGPQPRRAPSTAELRADAAAAEDVIALVPEALGNLKPWTALAGLTVGYWVSEDLALTLSYAALGSSAENNLGPQLLDRGVQVEDVTLVSVLLGVRRYLAIPRSPGIVRPYVSADVGSFIGSIEGRSLNEDEARWTQTMGTMGGQLGAGVDIQLTRYLMLGLRGAYNLMADFDEPLGGRDNYNGGEFRIGVSWVFGGA